MTNHPFYRFLLFIGTFAAILFGVFLVFKFFGSTGEASTNNSGGIDVTQAGDVASTTIAFTSDDLGIIATATSGPVKVTSTSAVARHAVILKASQTQAEGSIIQSPVAPAKNSNLDLSSDLSKFELSLADAVRSISIPQTQALIPSASISNVGITTVASATVAPTATATTAVATATSTPIVIVTAATSSNQSLPYVVNNFSDLSDWQREWGSVSIESSSLAIGAMASTTGGEALLLNSNLWTNYIATAVVDWKAGETFSLLARYNPGMNNVSCEFLNDGEVSIYQTLGGQRTLLGMGTVLGFNPGVTVTASIQVKNDHVQCTLNGDVVSDYLYRGMPQSLLSGGFDIETWDPTQGKAQILVQSISVEPLY